MQGHEDVIELLNEVLTAELTAVNQYFLDAKMFDDDLFHPIGGLAHMDFPSFEFCAALASECVTGKQSLRDRHGVAGAATEGRMDCFIAAFHALGCLCTVHAH